MMRSLLADRFNWNRSGRSARNRFGGASHAQL